MRRGKGRISVQQVTQAVNGGLIVFDEAQRIQASETDGITAARVTELGGEIGTERV